MAEGEREAVALAAGGVRLRKGGNRRTEDEPSAQGHADLVVKKPLAHLGFPSRPAWIRPFRIPLRAKGWLLIRLLPRQPKLLGEFLSALYFGFCQRRVIQALRLR